ncbi:MAG TPA: hypothetical protein VF902_10785, partial [Coriobacteriia bacterium]
SKPHAGPGRSVSILTGLGCVAATTVLLVWVSMLAPTVQTLAPIAGLVAALACRKVLDAVLVAPAGLAAGLLAFQVTTAADGWSASLLHPGTLAALAVSALVALGARGILAKRSALAPLMAGIGVALILGTVWLGTMLALGEPVAANGDTRARVFAGTPEIAPGITDEALYLVNVRRIAAGGEHYAVLRRTMDEANAAQTTDAAFNTASPYGYRLPTLFRLLAWLPNNGVSYSLALLLFGSAAAVAAYALARRRVVRPLALVGAAAVAGFYAGIARKMFLFETEPWAGALILISLTLGAAAYTAKRRSLVWSAAAAGAALAAFLFRELAVAAVLAGLLTTLLDPDMRRERHWIPWLVALAVAAALYVGHVASAARAAEGGTLLPHGPFPWFAPDGSGLLSGLRVTAALLGVVPPVAWALLALAALGVTIVRGPLAMRLHLASVVAGGALLLALFHPPGSSNVAGLVPAYWVFLVMPSMLACVPLALARLLPSGERPATSEPQEEAGSSPAVPADDAGS